MSDFWTPMRIRFARKTHTCQTCYRMIYEEEEYMFSSGMYDGTWSPFKMCMHCYVTQKACDIVDFDGLISESGFEDWQDNNGYIKPEHPNRIVELRAIVNFRNKWKTPGGKLVPVPKFAVESAA